MKQTHLVQICPKIPHDRVEPLIQVMENNGINTNMRIAAFLAQCGHESADFTRTTENLNYSTERLLQVFPKYFKTTEEAARVARNPEAIANIVYSGRMGNGASTTGDGYKFRGRGYIGLTGRDNYTKFSAKMGVDAVANPDYVATPEGAALSAVWFWNSRDLNPYADRGAMVDLTRKINGGVIGLEDRMKRYEKALEVLNT